ncbi:MAG: tRNA (adenosine(37)-N6)-dimethylallyltransferase MiaA, partial [Burkholderiales bacterium]
DRSILHERIAERFESMLDAGLVEETESLRKRFDLDPAMPSMRTVGYRQAWQYLDGEFGKKDLVEKGVAATRQLAKRQLTWLRSMENVQQFDCLDPALHRKVAKFLRKSLEE